MVNSQGELTLIATDGVPETISAATHRITVVVPPRVIAKTVGSAPPFITIVMCASGVTKAVSAATIIRIGNTGGDEQGYRHAAQANWESEGFTF